MLNFKNILASHDMLDAQPRKRNQSNKKGKR